MPNQIEFIKPDSGIIPLFQREPVVSVTKGEQVIDLLGGDIIRLTIESVEALEFNIQGKIVIYGKQYTLNQLPTAEVKGERHFVYDMTLEGVQHELRRPVYFNTDVSGFNTTSEVDLTGDIEMFVDVLINNANRVFGSGTWLKGDVPSTGVKTITFDQNNCLAALQTFCKEFEQEFEITQSGSVRTIHIRKAGQVLGHVYEHGRGQGLFQLIRRTVTDNDIITRLYAYGSTKNLKSNYRNFSNRLRLPDPEYIEDATAIANFGVLEASKIFEDIYPHRTGTVSGVSGALSFSDAGMNFDLNETDGLGTKYLLAGTTAKIHFNSGNLAGYEFELLKYVHSTKTFTLTQFEDERGLKLPNETEAAFQIQVGDQYVILDIVLPDSYIESAELELAAEAQLWLDQNKAPRVQYSLEVDEMYLKALHDSGSIVNVFGIGDYIQVRDTTLGIDRASRIISLTRDILKPYKYALTLDDTYTVNIRQVIIDISKEVKTIVKTGGLKDVNRLRMGWLTTQELLRKIFDTDGYFDGGKIKPETVETLALVVGAKSQQFVLQNIVFEPNFEGQVNVVHVSAGQLIHYAIAETVKTWDIEETTVTILDNNSRYIYAKVSKTDDGEGYIIFSEDQILPDQDPNYYHFLVGLLHTAVDGVRWISLTYGATAINGRFIKTGRIQSFDGSTYFDLDLGQIGGYIRFRDSQGNYRDLSDIGAQTDMFWKMSMINAPETYVAGFATNWFQQTDPATWPGGEESFHEGDNWYNPDTSVLKRRVGGAWVTEPSEKAVDAFTLAYTRVGNNSKIRTFTAEPTGPYSENDLWMSPDGLLRSLGSRVTGFDPLHWVIPFNYDNTETAINGGVLTSGTIQLAGDNYTVLAGITGHGTEDESTRFWAGASYENRSSAPFRVDQGGRLFARTRIEVEGVDGTELSGYKGQAGLAGSEVEGEEGIRIYAGSNWEGKETAPFRVSGEGFVWMEKGIIGNWSLDSSGSFFNNSGDASIITRSAASGAITEAMIGPNIFSSILGGIFKGAAIFRANEVHAGGNNYGAIFEASGAIPGIFGENGQNFAIYAGTGRALINESLINGAATLLLTNNGAPGTLAYADPTLYDLIIYSCAGGGTFLTLVKEQFSGATYANTLKDGNTVTIIAINNGPAYRLWHTVRPISSSSININGGSVLKLRYYAGAWYIESHFDNNY